MSRSVARYALLALFVIGAGVIVYALASAMSGPKHADPLERYIEGDLAGLDLSRAGEALPAGTFSGPEGETLSLEDFRGKTLLVNFWATWCAPCEREMPHLGALETARGGSDFEVIAISVDQSTDEAYARERIDELTGGVLTFYHAPPESWDLIYNAGARGFPTTVVYGPDGSEIARLAGEADWSEGIALAFVDEVLGH
jgi:thiol-disulfide isomerase/thioredoxin